MTETYDFVHLAIKALGGEVQGKTKLQKLVYFIGVITARDQELGYRPHFYGPYSDEVAEAVDSLLARGFLDRRVAGIGRLDNRGFEVARTDYTLTDDGRKIAERKSRAYPAVLREIDEAVTVLQKIMHLDYMKLSVAAKTYFLLKANPQANLPSLAGRFGWSVTPEQISEAERLLASIHLDPKAA